MIRLENISKTFISKDKAVDAVKDVSINIKSGEIYGIIGYSGAGKSSLIRCINLLENPDRGKVIFNGENITNYKDKKLRDKRKEIGMIFQNFNLFDSRTVYGNIVYPLKDNKFSKDEEKERVEELVKLVGLEDKLDSYPSQLSGGQKQRVAIARALANKPKVLLCDEATSALDPKTTKSILGLLKDLNERLGITIVLITHEMKVIKEICHRVSIMANGKIVEEGDTVKIFSNPENKETKEFLQIDDNKDKIKDFIELNKNIFNLGNGDILAKITYIGKSTGQALISKASRKFNLDISILYGQVEILNNVPVGELIICFYGDSENIKDGIKYFEDNNSEVEVIEYE